ncbi:MAG: hypothetical protein JSV66_16680 [Trueperaceae bacterium]|nr:MAG: hypothetical protein JSV66_16680 [Trueperaceae bacterium]
MRHPGQLRLAALLGSLASLAFAVLIAFVIHLLLGRVGRVGFNHINAAGLLETVVFVLAFSNALSYARSAIRLPSQTLLSFGMIAPPAARRVAQHVPLVDAGQDLQILANNRIVIVQERGVPIGVTGLRRGVITPWEDLVKVDGRVVVTDLRSVLSHEPLVIVIDSGSVKGIVTQEMYLGGLWGPLQ